MKYHDYTLSESSSFDFQFDWSLPTAEITCESWDMKNEKYAKTFKCEHPMRKESKLLCVRYVKMLCVRYVYLKVN